MFQDLCIYYFLELTFFKSDFHSLKSEQWTGICAFIRQPGSCIDAVLVCGVRKDLSQTATVQLEGRCSVADGAPHWGIRISLSLSSYKTLYSLSSLVSIQLFFPGWMHHHLVTNCCSEGKSGTVSPHNVTSCLRRLPSLLVVPVLSHQQATLASCFLGARKWEVTSIGCRCCSRSWCSG